MIVPVGERSFELAEQKGIYAFPSSYSIRTSDYIAFYRTSPISAITHFAPVVGQTDGDDHLSQIDRILMFPERSDEPVSAFELGDLQELGTPVASEKGRGVQGRIYADIEAVIGARTVTDLLDLAGG